MPGRTWWPEKAAGTAATGALDTVARTAATAATTKPGSVDLEPSRILPVAGNAGRKCVSAALDLLGNAVSAAGGAGAGRGQGQGQGRGRVVCGTPLLRELEKTGLVVQDSCRKGEASLYSDFALEPKSYMQY